MALECGGISWWLRRVGASPGGFGVWGGGGGGHLQVALESVRITRSGGISRGFGEWGHLQVALESEGITRGFGEWGHLQVALECGGNLQVALESGGIYRLLWSVWASPGVGASPGGFGEWALESVGNTRSGGISRWLWRVWASTGGFGE